MCAALRVSCAQDQDLTLRGIGKYCKHAAQTATVKGTVKVTVNVKVTVKTKAKVKFKSSPSLHLSPSLHVSQIKPSNAFLSSVVLAEPTFPPSHLSLSESLRIFCVAEPPPPS